MNERIADLEAECIALGSLLQELPNADWERVTAFFDWTVADEVMHLHLVDGFGIRSLTRPDSFPDLISEVRAGQARGFELSDRMRAEFGHLSPARLLDTWNDGWRKLCALFKTADMETRMPWFGPSMDVPAFVTARQMEVWAHGQDIYDLLRIRRANGDQIRNICELGVRTHGWSFANRKIARPERPEVRLTAPSGTHWVWNEGAEDRIAGPAEDFALVVTQRRNFSDTALEVSGEGARAWMAIAQCFAGAPAQPPAKGQRVVEY